MTNDYDRIRGGIEFMTAYLTEHTPDGGMLAEYLHDRRTEEPMAAEQLLDGTAALCALLLRQLAHDNGTTDQAVLQEVARASHRSEQKSGE
ncbi:hypothetical protein [Streptomyces sp. NPDC052225]|uniref:hypothetical protein n=1 Tax=Streptomyces sp. NPDC052225 TaxID=3154949 RepID=UPI00342D2201